MNPTPLELEMDSLITRLDAGEQWQFIDMTEYPNTTALFQNVITSVMVISFCQALERVTGRLPNIDGYQQIVKICHGLRDKIGHMKKKGIPVTEEHKRHAELANQ